MNVIVVGAGVIGCAVAHELSSRGASVRIIDGRAPGKGATFASAGILTPAVEGHNPELLRLTSCSLGLYDEFIRRVQIDSGLAIDYARSGTMQVAFTAEQAADLADNARRFEAAAVESQFLSAADARSFEPALSSSIAAALRLPTQGYVSAEQLISALTTAAAKHGAHIVTNRVERIVDSSSGVSVVTSNEIYDADAVVIATGSWTLPSIDGAMGAPVKPIRGQLLHLRVDSPVASQVLWGPDCYLVPWRDGSVLVGATVEDVGFDERPTVDGVRSLLTAGVTMVPALDRATFQEVRVGLRPKTADELPAIGRSSTMHHVFHAMGLYRNGVLLAPLTAMLVADLVLEQREHDELALVRPERLGL